jgi:hypothetical protein
MESRWNTLESFEDFNSEALVASLLRKYVPFLESREDVSFDGDINRLKTRDFKPEMLLSALDEHAQVLETLTKEARAATLAARKAAMKKGSAHKVTFMASALHSHACKC